MEMGKIGRVQCLKWRAGKSPEHGLHSHPGSKTSPSEAELYSGSHRSGLGHVERVKDVWTIKTNLETKLQK